MRNPRRADILTIMPTIKNRFCFLPFFPFLPLHWPVPHFSPSKGKRSPAAEAWRLILSL